VSYFQKNKTNKTNTKRDLKWHGLEPISFSPLEDIRQSRKLTMKDG